MQNHLAQKIYIYFSANYHELGFPSLDLLPPCENLRKFTEFTDIRVNVACVKFPNEIYVCHLRDNYYLHGEKCNRLSLTFSAYKCFTLFVDFLSRSHRQPSCLSRGTRLFSIRNPYSRPDPCFVSSRA